MPYSKEQQKEYNRQYYLANKDKIKSNVKKYTENNKELVKEYQKQYFIDNREHLEKEHKVYNKQYSQTEQGKKMKRISKWRSRGIICDDFDILYEYYLSVNECENCGIVLCEGVFGNNKRVLDHDHKTGLFRNVLCNGCNIARF